MNNIKHRASPSPSPFFHYPKINKAYLPKAKMRYISEITLLLVTTTAALTGEKIDVSVLKTCKHSGVS